MKESAIEIVSPLTGWIVPIEDMPDAVFARKMLGDGLAVDPIDGMVRAPIAGTVHSVHEAGHAITLTSADEAVELLVHVGVDTVALKGEGFSPLVEPGVRVAAGDPLLQFDLDLLVRRARAVVTPVILSGGEGWCVSDRASGPIVAGAPLFRLTRSGETARDDTTSADGPPALSRTVEVRLDHGLHARPAARIVAAVGEYDAHIRIRHGERAAQARSASALLKLGIGAGASVTIEGWGPEAAEAADATMAILREREAPEPACEAPAAMAALLPGDLRAVPAAPGLAIARAMRLTVAERTIPDGYLGEAAERDRLDDAMRRVGGLLRSAGDGDTQGAVLAAQAGLLEDPDLRAAADRAIAQGANAAAAFRQAARGQMDAMRASGNARIAERADDFRDLEGRVLDALLGPRGKHMADYEGRIVLAEELLPSQIVDLAAGGAAGFALAAGGPTSHAAILAAGAGLPMVVAVGADLLTVESGAQVILDADRGVVATRPDPDRIAAAQARRERERAALSAAARDRAPARLASGERIELFANLGSLADARAAIAAGAEGCGLLRTEFLFLDRATPPDRVEQAEQYQAIADALGDRPLIVRLLDIGGDKPAPYLDLPVEENPALGLRGIRVSLQQRALLDTQIGAILDVAPAGRCRIMAPMVASVAELDSVIAAVEAAGGGCDVGVMVETPAAAIGADLLARRAAFLSIGSNDLTQYALAMDRGNPAVAAGLDGLHPAVLRLIAATCDGAAGHDCPVGVCGGLAADPLAVPILIGLGVTELSVPPARLAAIRAIVTRLDRATARDHARAMLDLPSAQAVRGRAAIFEETLR